MTLTTLAIGGNLYADKSLKAYYELPTQQRSNSLSINYRDFQMGALQGQANWTAELILDPCQPEDIIKLSGQDQIRRSWKGYQIQSNVKVVQAQDSVKILSEQPIDIQTNVNWLGYIHTTLKTPEIIQHNQQIQSNFAPMTVKLSAKPEQQQLKILDLSLDMPNLMVADASNQFQISGLQLKTNQGLNGAILETGKTNLKIDLLKMSNRNVHPTGNVELKNYQINSDNALTERMVNTKLMVQFDAMKMPYAPLLQNAKFNFEVKDLNRSKLQNFLDVVLRSDNRCYAKEILMRDFEPALLAVLNQGFQVESKDNQWHIGNGKAKASMTGRFMPSHQKTLKSMVSMVPSLVEYKADMQFDKNMVASIMKSLPGQKQQSMSDQELESILSSMQQSGQLKRDGDVMKMSMEYKYGDKKFLTE